MNIGTRWSGGSRREAQEGLSSSSCQTSRLLVCLAAGAGSKRYMFSGHEVMPQLIVLCMPSAMPVSQAHEFRLHSGMLRTCMR